MTDDEINRAVAMELGWRPHVCREKYWVKVFGEIVVADFCTEHSAAAEMRKAVTPCEKGPMDRMLDHIVPRSPFSFDLVNSTPRQQAEAFLRMRGKWVEKETV